MVGSYLNKIQNIALPITEQLSAICSLLKSQPNLVLQAEPGAGKTTLVPLALLDTIAVKKKIIVLEPRRLAARNAAVRMAKLLDEPIGKTVGYRIRNESRTSKTTRIEVVTEGILTRMIQSDPELSGIGLIVFDEFHERSLDAELGLAFALEVQQSIREDLKLLVMSATLNSEAISKLLGNAPIVKSEGRSFPVSVEYSPAKKTMDWSTHLVNTVVTAIRTVESNQDPSKFPKEEPQEAIITPSNAEDILVFLPGVAEIKRAESSLTDLVLTPGKFHLNWTVMTLYGDLPFDRQRQVLRPIKETQRIILSTNIAETSVTIDGVGTVIDSGLMRQSSFDANVGFNRLFTKKISAASATQRTGRAGRLAEGYCYRLWSQSDALREDTLADIHREDLARFCLEIANWGINDPSELSLLEPPNPGNLCQAKTLLNSIQALEKNGKITQHGKKLISLGVHPRIGHMLLEAKELGLASIACLIAAMLEEKDVFSGQARYNPDFLSRIEFVIDRKNNTRQIKQIWQQTERLYQQLNGKAFTTNKILGRSELQQELESSGKLLAIAFPDRIAQRRGMGFRLSNGVGALANQELDVREDYQVVVGLGGQGKTPKIFQAIGLSKIELDEIYADQFIDRDEVAWDSKTQKVEAHQIVRFGELEISKKLIRNPDKKLIVDGLICGIKALGIDCLPWTKELRQWQQRLLKLRDIDAFSELYPNISDDKLQESLSDWLAPFIQSCNRLSQVTSDILRQALHAKLDWSQHQELDRLMPTRIKVASGSMIAIDYLSGDKPVLAVKLQEMFGVAQTPQLAEGRIPILIHLLSPARRPLQITEDLNSFWSNSYEEVKKQMRGRYPKHPWPDDPLEAQATRYTKRKK
jgi:ATP-dependent helicase HrpB